jgi:hypothetical protein
VRPLAILDKILKTGDKLHGQPQPGQGRQIGAGLDLVLDDHIAAALDQVGVFVDKAILDANRKVIWDNHG